MAKIPTFMLVVAAVLERADGRLLMQKRPLGKHHGGLWEFPGGKVEPHENPRDALVRELAEELAIAVDPGALSPVSFADNTIGVDETGLVILLYTVRSWDGEPRSTEGAEIGWFSLPDLDSLAVPPLDADLVARLKLARS